MNEITINGETYVKKQIEKDGKVPVVVCTEKRGVFFGWAIDKDARPIKLTGMRMCLYWSENVGGVLGLAEVGPLSGCKISRQVTGESTIEFVTVVMEASADAAEAWKSFGIQGADND